jgi:hypothetical protein
LKDLITLTACKNAQFAMKGILSRDKSLRIRKLTAETFVHPERDPGCAKGGVDFLRSQTRRYRHAILMFDYEGCGLTGPVGNVVTRLRSSLSTSGWGDRAEVILLNPELETWVWSDSPEVENVLGWAGRIPSLRAWLLDQGWITSADQVKPSRPKEAVERVLREVDVKRSSNLYNELASRVSFNRCTDEAFLSLVAALQHWFAVPQAPRSELPNAGPGK